MQYVIVAYDGTDEAAGERRREARPHHIALGDAMVESGQKLYGAAVLSEEGAMTGSVAILDVPTRADVDEYLSREPYVIGNVWHSIETRSCRRRPSPMPPLRPSDLPPSARTQQLIIGLDGTDAGAKDRRLDARPAHIALGEELIARSEMLYGVVLLDAAGEMCGSVLVMDFPSTADLDSWLASEPYVVGDVWESVEVRPCRVGPSQQRLHRAIGEPLIR